MNPRLTIEDDPLLAPAAPVPPDGGPPATPPDDPPPSGPPVIVNDPGPPPAGTLLHDGAALAAVRMARRFTTPFARGVDTTSLRLSFVDGVGSVDPYDFAEHIAEFDRDPEPRYVLGIDRDLDQDTAVTVTYTDPAAQGKTVTVHLPAGTRGGSSILLDLPVSITGRIKDVAMTPPPADGRAELTLTLTALLGNLSKLLWVIGGERDRLRREEERTVAQRHLPSAVGLSLDLIGFDLGVPRFPPLPYGFDQDTVALYHLDDDLTKAPTVADLTAAYPGRSPGHPGSVTGSVLVGEPGRYGRAFRFRDAGGSVDVASSPAFDIVAGANATIECFVRPDAAADGPVLSRHPAPDGAGAGWVLSVGTFNRGLARNVRFRVSDGGPPIDLFADRSVATDTFTHVAAVVDRTAGLATLFIDGVAGTPVSITGLGPVVNTAPLRIGAAAGGFRGVVDEVRISSVARRDFAPALGEADDHYRRRLRIFRRWSLPTPANLTRLLNELVGPITEGNALIVDDNNAQLVRGTRLIHIRPVLLKPNERIDAAGRRRVDEASAVGTAAQEDAFDPDFLVRHNDSTVDYATAPSRALAPGERPPDAHLMQVGVADRLDRLIALAAAESNPPGRVFVRSAFDPRAGDLRATGRAVLLGHSTVAPGRLAALAHRAGFDFVHYRPGVGPAQVYAASALGDYVTIAVAPLVVSPPNLSPRDVEVSEQAALSLRPTPPADAFVRWLVVPNGAGRATITPDAGPGTPQQTAKLTATAAGPLVIRAEITRGRRTVSATRPLRVGLASLDDKARISADGRFGVDPSTLDIPTFFHPAFLVQHNDPRATYGTDPNHHLMQPAVAELLDALLSELAFRQIGGHLQVTGAFNPGGDTAAKEGRELVLRHSIVPPDVLASSVFAVGFDHIERNGADLIVRQRPGQLAVVRGPAGSERVGVIEVDEGSTVELTTSPTPDVLKAAGLPGPLDDLGPRLGWSSGRFDQAGVTPHSNTQPTVNVTADTAGVAWVQASYQIGTAPTPYTFQVRLRPPLDTPATVIPKDQHDLIMNILNVLHPVGVEVNTSGIREHVVELRGDPPLLPANPDYTYPKFRVRGVLPRQVRRPADG